MTTLKSLRLLSLLCKKGRFTFVKWPFCFSIKQPSTKKTAVQKHPSIRQPFSST